MLQALGQNIAIPWQVNVCLLSNFQAPAIPRPAGRAQFKHLSIINYTYLFTVSFNFVELVHQEFSTTSIAIVSRNAILKSTWCNGEHQPERPSLAPPAGSGRSSSLGALPQSGELPSAVWSLDQDVYWRCCVIFLLDLFLHVCHILGLHQTFTVCFRAGWFAGDFRLQDLGSFLRMALRVAT